MPGNYSFSGLEAIREVDNHGDLTPGTRVEIGLTESGNLAFKKKSRVSFCCVIGQAVLIMNKRRCQVRFQLTCRRLCHCP